MSPKTINLSAIIIAKNEGRRIGATLKSLAFADEVLVVDSGSTDDTLAIAKNYHAIIVSENSENFASLRNAAATVARGTWLLYVDADETVTPDLATAIRTVITGSEIAGYELKRVNYYLGTRWPGNEWMLRLMQKKALRKWEGRIHETAILDGVIRRLAVGSLQHDTHRSLSEMVDKTNVWSESEADLRIRATHPPVVPWRIIRVMMTGFWDSYIRKGGWRAGTVGIIESMYQAFSMFITYAKLWERQQKKSP